MNRTRLRHLILPALLPAAVLVTVVGCEHALSPYRGPQPEQVNLSSEVVTVRYVEAPVLGQHSFLVDRVRFVEAGDAHNVNRVVMLASSQGTVDAVTALNLQPGDRIIVSTQFSGLRTVGDLREIPNWPGHRYYSYPIGVHLISAVTRAP